MRSAVALPPGEDQNEWLASNSINYNYYINLSFFLIFSFLTFF